mmetsp:Transcript_105298/g.280364  ORF Transcript_105298/g.280364 Transcript_105298/m.280364 type:complete len:242 (-) Transcript_105298:5-730(-)
MITSAQRSRRLRALPCPYMCTGTSWALRNVTNSAGFRSRTYASSSCAESGSPRPLAGAMSSCSIASNLAFRPENISCSVCWTPLRLLIWAGAGGSSASNFGCSSSSESLLPKLAESSASSLPSDAAFSAPWACGGDKPSGCTPGEPPSERGCGLARVLPSSSSSLSAKEPPLRQELKCPMRVLMLSVPETAAVLARESVFPKTEPPSEQPGFTAGAAPSAAYTGVCGWGGKNCMAALRAKS